jgi:hypothetical protein
LLNKGPKPGLLVAGAVMKVASKARFPRTCRSDSIAFKFAEGSSNAKLVEFNVVVAPPLFISIDDVFDSASLSSFVQEDKKAEARMI